LKANDDLDLSPAGVARTSEKFPVKLPLGCLDMKGNHSQELLITTDPVTNDLLISPYGRVKVA